MTTAQDLYDPRFVAALFDEMAATYGLTNYVASFGFCKRWREACVALGDVRPGMVVYDLMTGMGECWHFIAGGLEGRGRLVALDLSTVMCRRAASRRDRFAGLDLAVVQEDVLESTLPSAAADRVISSFGLKTFSQAQQALLAREIARLLKPGGRFALVEIAVPPSRLLRAPYLFYLKRVVPWIGRLFLGNPEYYRLLGRYTEAFSGSATMAGYLRSEGLEVTASGLFFGCATALHGARRVS